MLLGFLIHGCIYAAQRLAAFANWLLGAGVRHTPPAPYTLKIVHSNIT